MHWKALKNKIVQCELCPKNCVIKPDEYGNCNARKNIDGALYSMVYGRACAIAIDPIEKKPLFHFLPGTKILSIGTIGCNMHCKFCQNWQTSQAKPEDLSIQEITPEQIVEAAKKEGCDSIGYTYNEPTIQYEFVLKTAKLARKEGIKNVMVTNGYINKKPAEELYQYIDAANVDLKGFSEEFYEKYCDAKLAPVLETMKLIKEKGVWLELTTLIIPGLNDSDEEIKKECEWIVKNLRNDVPLHFSRFFPMYKMHNQVSTPEETLLNAREIAHNAGINYTYIGNMRTKKYENTCCPHCQKELIIREGFLIIKNNLAASHCKFCNSEISGIWQRK